MTPQAALTFMGSALGALALIGAAIGYLRRGFVSERDQVRVQTAQGWRDVAEAKEALCDAELAERDHWIGRLEQHHDLTHRRCSSGPSRGA